MKAADVIGGGTLVALLAVLAAVLIVRHPDVEKAAPKPAARSDEVAYTFRIANDGTMQLESDLAACRGELERERAEPWWLRPHWSWRPGGRRVWIQNPEKKP